MTPELGATLAFGLLALLLIFIGAKRGFFKFSSHEWVVPIRLLHLIGAFAIYFICSSLIARIAISIGKKEMMLNFMRYSSWLNFGISFLIFFFLAIYFFCLSKPVKMGIWKKALSHSYRDDVWAAFYAWIMAFPLVLFLSQLIELILTKIFHLEKFPEQIAVKFFKSTFSHPLYFTLALISIVILAPLIEETLFRGFLQTYIRKHLGRIQAIVITSVCFSLFHYAAGQGLGNISIIISLFVLSLFLGFIYEKQESLLAPMTLHATFNMVSVINLYLFGGFTSGI